MAFGGAQANRTVGVVANGNFVNYMKIDGLTLAAWAATPPVIANADSGELTTAAAGANQNAIPNTIAFGKGRGNWAAGDEFRVVVTVEDEDAVQQNAGTGATSLPHVVTGSPRVAAGDLLITFHNRGNAATGALQIGLQYIGARA